MLQFEWLVDFYATAITALEAFHQSKGRQRDDVNHKLGRLLATVHDPQRHEATDYDPKLLRGRIERHEQRLADAKKCIELEPRADRAGEVITEDLSTRSTDSLCSQVLAALVEAHLRVHRIEHLQSHCFGDSIRLGQEIQSEVILEARHSLALNTFAYVVSRSAPWIFAEDRLEREYVATNYDFCYRTLTPTYCMWIGLQCTMLALHRRGYTWWLLGDMSKAYGDFHKLKRFVSSAERSLEESSIEAPGAQTFLTALSALADHHIGRIYRAQHAHTAALRHFGRAIKRIERLDGERGDPETRAALANSRWRIHLLIGQGQANYELGMVKHALLCYVRAWRAFLVLMNTEGEARANVEVAERVIGWLESIVDDPEIDKVALARHFSPLVSQLEMALGPLHLRLLLAEIIKRVGHVLLMLRLPNVRQVAGRSESHSPEFDDHLAEQCLRRANKLDPSSTSIAADLLKIDYRRSERSGGRARRGDNERDERGLGIDGNRSALEIDIARHWSAGGGRFEGAARIIEYTLQHWLNQSDDEQPHGVRSQRHKVRRQIARELLAVFLYHTDNTNVKLAQVYRYLMQAASDRRGLVARSLPPSAEDPTLEFVCARRYSSFFPFLPRPSAFRVPGGGYFLQIYEHGHAFGIVIDPGSNFLHNLYSCGYSLDDINMVIVTHDHADHLAALDPLLALLGYKAQLGTSKFQEKGKLAIVGNASVVKRYEFYRTSIRDRVAVLNFETLCEITHGKARAVAKKIFQPIPASLRITQVASVEHIDAADAVAQAFLLSVGTGKARSSVLFTSDTGIPQDLDRDDPKERERVARGMPFVDALAEATIVVAHVSSVRLPELRKISGLIYPIGDAAKMSHSFEALWQEIYAQSKTEGNPQQTGFSQEELDDFRSSQKSFLRELQFGFHSKATVPNGLTVSPLANPELFRKEHDRHLYLTGLLAIAERIAGRNRGGLLLIGELREELGTFRTGIAATLNKVLFKNQPNARALTMDIGLRLRITAGKVQALCSTCDLDNDLVDAERFHPPCDIREVCVRGEDEGVFYNCTAHDRRSSEPPAWVERVERYDPFGRYDPFRP